MTLNTASSACCLFATLGALAACSGSEDVGTRPRAVLYTGRLEGTDALLSVAYDGTHSVAYSCGGAETFQSLTGWYQNALSSGSDGVHLHAVSEDKELNALLSGGAITGTVAVKGSELAFVATPPENNEDAGLFESMGSGCRTGLLIPPRGDAQGVWCAMTRGTDGADTLVFAQVTPIRPWSPNASAVRVRVDGSADELLLRPVTLPLE